MFCKFINCIMDCSALVAEAKPYVALWLSQNEHSSVNFDSVLHCYVTRHNPSNYSESLKMLFTGTCAVTVISSLS